MGPLSAASRPALFALLLGALLALLLCALFAPRARADTDSEARARYERAIELYERGVYDAALVELNRAMELKPSYKALYNIAQVRLAMDDYAGALEAYRQYLSQGGSRILKARREAVQTEVEQLGLRVAELTIQSNVSGAEVLVDDLAVGTTPLVAPVLVNAGLRRVVVRHPHFPSESRRVSVAGGDRLTVELSLRADAPSESAPAPATGLQPVAAPSPPPRPLPPAPVEQTRGRSSTPAWIAWSVTGALAAGALTTGLLALRASSDVRDKREHELVESGELEAEISHSERLAWSSDALTGAAVLAAGVSLWLTLRTRRDGAGAPDKASASRPKLRVGLASLSLQGDF